MSPEEEIRFAGKAREVLENEAFKRAVRDLEQALLDGIKRSAFKDTELREKLALRYASLHDILTRLESFMEGGKFAEATLAQKLRKVVGL